MLEIIIGVEKSGDFKYVVHRVTTFDRFDRSD